MAYTNRICTNNYLFHSFVYFFLQSLCHMSLVGTSLGFLLWHCCLEIAALPHLHMLHSRFSVKIVRCSVSMYVNVNHCVCMWIQCVLMNIHVQYDNKCQFTPSRSFRNVECHQTILSFLKDSTGDLFAISFPAGRPAIAVFTGRPAKLAGWLAGWLIVLVCPCVRSVPCSPAGRPNWLAGWLVDCFGL